MDAESKKSLKKFIEFTANNKELALIIIEKNASRPSADFLKKLDKNIIYFSVNQDTGYNDISLLLLDVKKKKKRLLLDIKVDLSQGVLSILKEISELGGFSADGKRGLAKKFVDFESGSLVAIADRDFIDKKIAYKNFLNLFDSAFSLEN